MSTRSEAIPMGDLRLHGAICTLLETARKAQTDREACMAVRSAIALKSQPVSSEPDPHARSDEIV